MQDRQGLAASQATGAKFSQPFFLAQLADVCGKAGQTEEGLTFLDKALVAVDKTGERFYEAELYRLKGELLLQRLVSLSALSLSVPNTQLLAPSTQEAEACFLKAIEIAQQPASQVVGTSSYREFSAAVAATKQTERSSQNVG